MTTSNLSASPPPFVPAGFDNHVRAAGIRAAFTTRAAGNLGLHVGDDRAAVYGRRAEVAAWAGRPVHFARHVHGVTVLEAPSHQHTPDEGEPVGDGWCAAAPAALAVLAADCVPVLFADPAARVIAAAHAGRVGLFGGMLDATVAAMRTRGAKNIHAVIGPAICGSCYEVSPAMANDAARAGFPVGTSRWGTPSIDLPGIAAQELQALGVQVQTTAWCTLEDQRFFSHRSADRAGGRHAGIITLGLR